MSNVVIQVEHLSKSYQYGTISHGTLYRDLQSWWARIRGKDDPNLKIDDTHRSGKSGERFWALHDLSFEVQQGEIVGIIGRNGAGKSTLLKIVSQITTPTKGCIKLRGRVGSLLEVGTGFHAELTGRENIYLNGAILGMNKAEVTQKFDDIVAFAELEEFIDTPVKRYSSGMYVRLAFAVAAYLEPEILLIDEVLAVGDVKFQEKCFGRLETVAQAGRTILLVSHNMPSIINLCQRAILLEGGSIAKDGKALDVVEHYLLTTRSAEGEVIWSDPDEAPGNDLVRLYAVRILQDGLDMPTADVDISKEIAIQLLYWNLQPNSIIGPSIWLRDKIGTVVLASSNHASVSLTKDPWYGTPHPPGLFQSTCRIPANFLNEGLYSVTAMVDKGVCTTQIFEDFVLSFYVHDTGEMRKEYLGEWIGTVRPRLAWHTEYLEHDPQHTS
ncbi:ATP-binding cassette domain-containing protein [candidate division KSB3 bacterium]|uniref:ATP-binding cassette domain-containing protein n=1 Tax=candidate division KSB3 bacterium TaxID=2044937 RepID=A0A9D5JZW4_9BACT|nr:ATP-binding cassette domain-containing protein [candidate division KSB3 bacterium]MBD3326846.1 ATP-binding cassette domain-containing protein [candidate division KSB3 bacterium]